MNSFQGFISILRIFSDQLHEVRPPGELHQRVARAVLHLQPRPGLQQQPRRLAMLPAHGEEERRAAPAVAAADQ